MKKQTTKRILATALACAMSISILAGCNNSPTTSSSNESKPVTSTTDTSSKSDEVKWTQKDGDVELNEPGKFPIVKEGQNPVELSIFAYPSKDNCSDFSSGVNPVTDYVENTLNLKFKWQMSTTADKTAKLNLMFSDGDYPDIIFGSLWNSATQYTYGKSELILPLNPYLENDSYYYDEFLENGKKLGIINDTQIKSLIMPDGNIYSLGLFDGAVHTEFAYRMWIYEPWLKAVDMKMPTTTEEYYNVLKAFKEKDPNGNNKNDEIPLTGALNAYNADPTVYLLNSFVYYSTTQRMAYVDNGKVVLSYQQPGFKDGIEYMRKLCSEDLLLSETFTQDKNALKALTTQDVQLVGSCPAGSIQTFTTVKNGKEGDWTNWKALSPLKGPNGIQYAETNTKIPKVKFNITNNCKHPLIAFRFADAMYEKEMATTIKNGMKGEYWDYAKDGQLGLDGKPAIYDLLQGGSTTEAVNFAWAQVTVACEPMGWHTGQAVSNDPSLNNESILYNAGINYSKYRADSKMILPPLFFNEDDSKKVTDLETSLNDEVASSMVAMITGKSGDFETAYTKFEKEVKDLGAEDLIKLYQVAYEAEMKK